jgi:hypothetical protein
MPDRWQTFPVQFAGGLMTNMTPLQQGSQFPGSATVLRNFEPSVEGGYRRIEGFTKWDSAQVTGTSAVVRGVCEYKQQAIAAVGDGLYQSSGSGWTELTDNATYSSSGINLSGSGRVRFAKHHFGTTKVLIIVDSDDKPYKFDGTTFSQISTATADVDGAEHVVEHKDHLFFAKGTTLTFTAPFDDEDFTPASGAGTIEFNNDITGLASFRQQLIVFTKRTIFSIAGSTVADFVTQPVTQDIGAIQPDTVQEIGGDLMFLGPDGLRLLSATERNNDFGLGVVSKVIQPEMTQFIAASTSFASVVIREKSQYRLLGYNSSYSDNAARGIIGTQFAQQGGEGMAWAETRGINAYVAYSEYVNDNEVILFANDDGYVYRMESGNSFDGANIIGTYKTPYLPITDPTTRKSLYKAKLFVDPQGSFSCDVDIDFDFNQAGVVQPDTIEISNTSTTASIYGTATYGSGSFGGGNLRYVFDEQLTGSGFVVAVSFSTDSTDPPFSLDSIVIQYGQYGRR